MDENKEINLLQLVSALLKRWWIIVIAAIVVGGGSFCFTYFKIQPTYTASALFYVNNSSLNISTGSISLSTGDISAAKSLVETYRVILGSRLTLEEVIKKANLKYSYNELYDMISTQQVNATEIFSVTVTSTNPQEACDIANTIAVVLPDKVRAVIEGTSVKVVDYAVVPTARSAPSYSRNAIMGALVGVLLAAAAIVIAELLNDSIQSEEWLVTSFGTDAPLLAVVPDDTVKGGRLYSKYGYSNASHSRTLTNGKE